MYLLPESNLGWLVLHGFTVLPSSIAKLLVCVRICLVLSSNHYGPIAKSAKLIPAASQKSASRPPPPGQPRPIGLSRFRRQGSHQIVGYPMLVQKFRLNCSEPVENQRVGCGDIFVSSGASGQPLTGIGSICREMNQAAFRLGRDPILLLQLILAFESPFGKGTEPSDDLIVSCDGS